MIGRVLATATAFMFDQINQTDKNLFRNQLSTKSISVMKNKLKFLFSVMWLFTYTIISAQTTASNVTVKGTPYLDDIYAQGVIHYANRTHAAPIRYNVFRDLIEYQQNGQPLVLDPNPSIKKVNVGSSIFVPLKYETNGKSKFGYFAVLDSGKVTLYAKKKITLLAARKGGALDGSDQPAEYKKSADTFYFRIGEGELQEVDNIKSMIATFPEKQEEMTQYAKKEKISPRKEKEIIQFVQYYNSL
jgi:hypothetical protein